MSDINHNSGLDRTARLLDLVPYVATHPGIPLEVLAKEFGITVAQLTQDLTTLWMCGLPGYTPLELIDISFDTGFVTISNAETLAKPRMLDRDEILALILGLQTLHEDTSESQHELKKTISDLIEKLVGFIDSRINLAVQAGTSSFSTERVLIQRAIENGKALRITYHSRTSDQSTTRVIHPVEITMSDGLEYVSAYCELTESYRTFRLDRIANIEEVGERRPQLPAPSTRDEAFTLRLSVKSRSREVSERFNLLPTISNGTYPHELEVEIFSEDWAIREIMGLSGQVSLVSPPELRASLRERALLALQEYQEYKA